MGVFLSHLRIVMFYLMMSQEDLAKISGLHVLRVKRIFNDNNCTFNEVRQILRALRMNMDDFFSFTPPRNL
ncbi:MAG: helix-turn-helix transcriptional regulator [Deltaproteobacteria bacterium]|jgi:hypothetical protein|nr:helix-turn-helix transcriptional regulator [Deltaproteobacteria bacterium]